MCMDEFVKILYDFMSIYRIFLSQNSHYRYLPIFYRYFFRNSSTSARAPQSRFFSGKIGIFRFFGEKSAILPIFPRFFLCFFFSVPAENRFFDDISTEKKRFFVPWVQRIRKSNSSINGIKRF